LIEDVRTGSKEWGVSGYEEWVRRWRDTAAAEDQRQEGEGVAQGDDAVKNDPPTGNADTEATTASHILTERNL